MASAYVTPSRTSLRRKRSQVPLTSSPVSQKKAHRNLSRSGNSDANYRLRTKKSNDVENLGVQPEVKTVDPTVKVKSLKPPETPKQYKTKSKVGGNVTSVGQAFHVSSPDSPLLYSQIPSTQECEVVWDCNSPGYSKEDLKQMYSKNGESPVLDISLKIPYHTLYAVNREQPSKVVDNSKDLLAAELDNLITQLHTVENRKKESQVCHSCDKIELNKIFLGKAGAAKTHTKEKSAHVDSSELFSSSSDDIFVNNKTDFTVSFSEDIGCRPLSVPHTKGSSVLTPLNDAVIKANNSDVFSDDDMFSESVLLATQVIEEALLMEDATTVLKSVASKCKSLANKVEAVSASTYSDNVFKKSESNLGKGPDFSTMLFGAFASHKNSENSGSTTFRVEPVKKEKGNRIMRNLFPRSKSSGYPSDKSPLLVARNSRSSSLRRSRSTDSSGGSLIEPNVKEATNKMNDASTLLQEDSFFDTVMASMPDPDTEESFDLWNHSGVDDVNFMSNCQITISQHNAEGKDSGKRNFTSKHDSKQTGLGEKQKESKCQNADNKAHCFQQVGPNGSIVNSDSSKVHDTLSDDLFAGEGVNDLFTDNVISALDEVEEFLSSTQGAGSGSTQSKHQCSQAEIEKKKQDALRRRRTRQCHLKS